MLKNPEKFILKNLRRDLHNNNISPNSIQDIEELLTDKLRILSYRELLKIKSEIEMNLQILELTSFDKLIASKMVYIPVYLSTISIMLNIKKPNEVTYLIASLIVGALLLFTIYIIIHQSTSNKAEREEIVYLRFKMKSVEKMINVKHSKRSRSKKIKYNFY